MVRLPSRTKTDQLTVESVPFKERWRADNWCEFIQFQHPRDAVFVIERMEPIPEDER